MRFFASDRGHSVDTENVTFFREGFSHFLKTRLNFAESSCHPEKRFLQKNLKNRQFRYYSIYFREKILQMSTKYRKNKG